MSIATNAGDLEPADFTVSTEVAGKEISVSGEKVEWFKSSTEELDILVLVQGNVGFMGDPTARGGREDEVHGYYLGVKESLDVIAKARPRNAFIALYTYGDTTVVHADFTQASAFSSELLGPQTEYSNVTGSALLVGLDSARRALSEKHGRRVLFLIGDGGDLDATASVQKQRQELEESAIDVYVLAAPSGGDIEPLEENRLRKLARLGALEMVSQKQRMTKAAEALARALNNVYTVDFAERATDGSAFPWDGDLHELGVAVKGDSRGYALLEPPPLELPKCGPPPYALFDDCAMVLVAIGGATLLAVIGVVRARGRRRRRAVGG